MTHESVWHILVFFRGTNPFFQIPKDSQNHRRSENITWSIRLSLHPATPLGPLAPHPFSLPLPPSFQRAQIVLQGGITWNAPLVEPSLLSEEPAKGHVTFPRCYLRAILPQFSHFSSRNVTHNCLQLLKYEDFLFSIVIYDSKRRVLGVWGCYSDKISNLKASLWTFGIFWWTSLTLLFEIS